MKLRFAIAAIAVSTGFAVSLGAQGVAPTPLPGSRAADSLFRAGLWAQAADAYRSLTMIDSMRPVPWVRLATAEYQLKQFTEAGRHFLRAARISRNPVHSYNAAASFAAGGSVTQAFEAFEIALAAGFNDTTTIAADKDFTAIRGDPRYATVVRRVMDNAKPCAQAAHARAFDFWLGSWDVRTPEGALAGRSTVALTVGECAVSEVWEPTAGAPGRSLSAYNPVRGRWQQLFVDTRGGVQEFVGEQTQAGIAFERVLTPDSARSHRSRMTFTKVDGGGVRQVGERSNDGGRTWTVEYDLLYARRTP
jgi:tetratricopeptide (TPR) repeat protein